jgi:hypothetical protein
MRVHNALAAVVGFSVTFLCRLLWAAVPPAAPAEAKLAFTEDPAGNLVFDTGVVKGSVKKEGLSDALKSVTYLEPQVPIDQGHGLLTPYRFLTPTKRYGVGSWEWQRRGRLLDDGSIALRWDAADERPFVVTAVYRWRSADTLDMTVYFKPHVDLEKFELFIGSYFRQFTKARVYVQEGPDGKPGFVESAKEKGGMQLYPRSADVLLIVNDGRWKHPPYPNNWAIRPALAAPLGMKRQPTSGVTVLIMAPPEDCFAVSTSAQEAGLGAFYLSLFGKDVQKDQTLKSRPRMVFGKDFTDEQALARYQEYLKDLGR